MPRPYICYRARSMPRRVCDRRSGPETPNPRVVSCPKCEAWLEQHYDPAVRPAEPPTTPPVDSPLYCPTSRSHRHTWAATTRHPDARHCVSCFAFRFPDLHIVRMGEPDHPFLAGNSILHAHPAPTPVSAFKPKEAPVSTTDSNPKPRRKTKAQRKAESDEAIRASMCATFARWLADPGTWIGIFENHDLSSLEVGRRIAFSFDQSVFDQAILRKSHAPDHREIGLGWRYLLIAKVRTVEDAWAMMNPARLPGDAVETPKEN